MQDHEQRRNRYSIPVTQFRGYAASTGTVIFTWCALARHSNCRRHRRLEVVFLFDSAFHGIKIAVVRGDVSTVANWQLWPGWRPAPPRTTGDSRLEMCLQPSVDLADGVFHVVETEAAVVITRVIGDHDVQNRVFMPALVHADLQVFDHAIS
jgi:hypothetical protein